MRLNDRMIREWAESGGVNPFDPNLINPASIDLRWSGRIRYAVYHGCVSIEDSRKREVSEEMWTEPFGYDFCVLSPGHLYLLDTMEYIKIPNNLSGILALKSSIGRIGIEHLHCISGDTLIDIPRDLRKYPNGVPVKELVNSTFLTYAFDETNMKFVLCSASAHKTQRTEKVVRVTYEWTSGGKYHKSSIDCTPDHKFLTLDGKWVEAKDLMGCRLRPFSRWIKKNKFGEYSEIIVDPIKKTPVYEHRFIASVESGFEGHHKDKNSLNNTPSNIEIMETGEHQKFHNREFGNPFLGKRHTDESKAKMSLAGRERKLSDEIKAKMIQSQQNHKVISVEELDQKQDTYDIVVPIFNNFVANGVVIHNSGYFDPGFEGTATLEMEVRGPWPVKLYAGDRIIQLVLDEMAEEPLRSYKVTGRYNGQTKPMPSK